jgi:hypothetical protein
MPASITGGGFGGDAGPRSARAIGHAAALATAAASAAAQIARRRPARRATGRGAAGAGAVGSPGTGENGGVRCAGSSSLSNAVIDGNRRAGSAVSPRRSVVSICGGNAYSRMGSITESLQILAKISAVVLPANGRAPVSASQAVTQKLNWSEATVASPAACSGAMYAGVPSTIPDRVSAGARSSPSVEPATSPSAQSIPRASPKSPTRTWPLCATKMLSGLRSRWMRPTSWAAASPRPAASSTSSTAGRLRGVSIHCRSVSPSTSAIAMNGRPSWVPTSWTATTFGCESFASACASRRSRSPPWAPRCSTLIATARPSSGSRARYTTPIPPRPSTVSIM